MSNDAADDEFNSVNIETRGTTGQTDQTGRTGQTNHRFTNRMVRITTLSRQLVIRTTGQPNHRQTQVHEMIVDTKGPTGKANRRFITGPYSKC